MGQVRRMEGEMSGSLLNGTARSVSDVDSDMEDLDRQRAAHERRREELQRRQV